MHFLEIFRKSSHHVNTNKGSVVKQSGNDVEGYRHEQILFQLNMRVILQYSVKFIRWPMNKFLIELNRKLVQSSLNEYY